MEKKLIIILSAIASGIFIGYFIAKNEYTNLDKNEIIDQLKILSAARVKSGQQSSLIPDETYKKYSKKDLIRMLVTDIKTTAI